MITEYEYFIVVILFVGSIVLSLRSKKNNTPSMRGVFSLDASHVMKAMCCIIIILHHWAFRVQSPWTQNLLTSLWGGYSLSVFFMLSTYGIAKSEIKHPLRAIDYAKHRIWKILKPYLIVVLLIIIAYWLIGANYPIEKLKQYRVNKYFVLIGTHQLEVVDYLKLIISAKRMSFPLWFVEVTIISYVYFFVAKTISGIHKHRIMMLAIYSILLLSTAIVLMQTVKGFPYIAFVRNVPMMMLGLLLALFEKDLMSKRLRLITCYVVFNILTVVFTFILEHSFTYVIYTNYAILSVGLLSIVLRNYELKKNSPIMVLSALSYLVYLIHSSLMAIEWWYIGYQSISLVICASVIMAYIYQCAMTMKTIKINIK